MKHLGLGVETLSARTQGEVSTQTISRLLKGNCNCFHAKAELLRAALELDHIFELTDLNDAEPVNEQRRIHEWLVDCGVTDHVTAANQLQFKTWKLRHEHLPKLARGKLYDLERMSSDERERCRALLLRHPLVCTKIGRHPNIIANISTCEDRSKDGWWVIDEWIDGQTLKDLRRRTDIGFDLALSIGISMAQALRVLHSHDIIKREFRPESILIEQTSNRVVLTDFELAKLLDGSPTVSLGELSNDPYRAPEAESEDVDSRADIFAFGRIVIELLCGRLPQFGKERDALVSSGVPSKFAAFLGKCVSISRNARPSNMDRVIEEFDKLEKVEK